MFDLTSLFVSTAYAADGAAPPMTGDVATDSMATLTRFLPLFLIFIVFYVLLIRPQQQQAQAHDKMIKELKKGDRVITKAGFVGTVSKIESEAYVMVEIAKGVEVRTVRESITGLIDDKHPSNENLTKKG